MLHHIPNWGCSSSMQHCQVTEPWPACSSRHRVHWSLGLGEFGIPGTAAGPGWGRSVCWAVSATLAGTAGQIFHRLWHVGFDRRPRELARKWQVQKGAVPPHEAPAWGRQWPPGMWGCAGAGLSQPPALTCQRDVGRAAAEAREPGTWPSHGALRLGGLLVAGEPSSLLQALLGRTDHGCWQLPGGQVQPQACLASLTSA